MPEKKPDDKQPKLSFEEALEKLEQIVSDIETGRVPLEQSIEKYEQGVKLVKQCRTILDTAEKRIQLLAESEKGQLEPSGELPDPEDSTGPE